MPYIVLWTCLPGSVELPRYARRVHRGLALFFKILLAIGVLALVVWNGLVEFSFIKDDPVAKLALLVITGAIILIDSLVAALVDFRKKGQDRRRVEIRKTLLPLLRSIARGNHLDITMLGASVFVVRRRWIFWSRLKRVERYRMSDLPQVSKVAWNRSKGAIGRAWRDPGIQHVDWRPIQARWGDGKVKTEQDWESVPEADRSGFSLEEFRIVVDKYAEILAIPMLTDSGKCVGVLALDVPLRANVTTLVLNEDSVVEQAAEATEIIKNVVH